MRNAPHTQAAAAKSIIYFLRCVHSDSVYGVLSHKICIGHSSVLFVLVLVFLVFVIVLVFLVLVFVFVFLTIVTVWHEEALFVASSAPILRELAGPPPQREAIHVVIPTG